MRIGVQLDETIFVDDWEPHVKGACVLGMRGIAFKDSVQTIADVRSCLVP